MDGGGAGEDVAGKIVAPAVPVGDHASGLLDQERTGGHIPGRQSQLEESIEDSCGRPGEVELGCTSPPQILEAFQGRKKNPFVLVQTVLVAEGESSGHDGVARFA